MQNVNTFYGPDTDKDGLTDGKMKTVYPLTYFVCRGYNYGWQWLIG